MQPLTPEWVEKAEADFGTATRELRVRKLPNYDAVCFHAQQCAEKYLKARLQEAGIPFSKTHNLIALLSLLLPIEPAYILLEDLLHLLNQFSVAIRYPGSVSDKAIARECLAACREVRRSIRASLGLPAK